MNIDKEREDFEKWAEDNLHLIDDMVYAKEIWLAGRASMQDDVRKDAERFKSIAENKLGVHFENNTVLGEIVEVYSNYDEHGNCHCDTERTLDAPIDALRLAIDKARE